MGELQFKIVSRKVEQSNFDCGIRINKCRYCKFVLSNDIRELQFKMTLRKVEQSNFDCQ